MHSRRAAVAVALAGAVLTSMGASQCGASSGSSTVTVSGHTLTIYASAPASLSSAASTDVVDAERLAFSQDSGKVAGFTIHFKVLTAKPSANARTAIQDKTAIAYLGEIDPGVSAGTMGITNAQDVLQVSPTDTALELTNSTPVVSGAPDNYYESHSTYGSTFARVVPSSASEAKAEISLMQTLRVSKLYVANDGSPYGKAIAHAVYHQASAAGLAAVQGAASTSGLTSSGSDAVFYGATAGTGWLSGVGGNVKVFVPSALAAASLPAGAYVSQPGFLAKQLPAPAQSRFVKPFESRYGHPPATEAIFGYEAMAAVLSVLHKAGSGTDNRTTVVHDFFAIRNRQSVLGTYSVDSSGNPSIAPFVFSRVRGGALVPFKSLQAGG